MDKVLYNDKLHGTHYQYLKTWYPGSIKHELPIKNFFNPFPAKDYVGIADFLENAQQRKG